MMEKVFLRAYPFSPFVVINETMNKLNKQARGEKCNKTMIFWTSHEEVTQQMHILEKDALE